MSIDRGAIDQQLQALGESSSWWDHRELRDLPAVLHGSEQILAISRGKVARPRWLRRTWLIVVTDERLLCLNSGSGTSWRQFEVGARSIARVAVRVGLFRGRVLVATAGRTYRLLVPRPDAYKLQAALAGIATPGREAITGFGPTRMVRSIMEHVLALPAAALDPGLTRSTVVAPAVDNEAMERRFQLLEDEVQQLRQQVDFLEDLLRQRAASMLPGAKVSNE
jgi:hypothetical protein